jgi:hypothetical protein
VKATSIILCWDLRAEAVDMSFGKGRAKTDERQQGICMLSS